MKKMIIQFTRFVRKVKRAFDKFMYLEYRFKYNLPRDFRFNGEGIQFVGNGDILIGKNSYIGRYSSIQVAENRKVIIGANCKISHFVKIYTTSSNPDQNFNNGRIENYSKDVIIGDGVWIGASVFINPGIIIGKNSVVGANSVLTKNVPENSIFGGVPAKLIKYKTHYEFEDRLH
jgi:maltose O-acetyltransferase